MKTEPMALAWAAKTLLLTLQIGGERLKPGLQRWSPGFSRSPRLRCYQNLFPNKEQNFLVPG